MKITDIPSETPIPDNTVKFTAGPSQQHEFSPDIQRLAERADAMSHRSAFAKQLISRANKQIFRLFGITEEKQNLEFNFDVPENNPPSWHVCWINSGTDGMERAIRAACPLMGTVLVNTDNFSAVAGQEMNASRRQFNEIKFERGEGLKIGSEKFEKLKKEVESGAISTIYITENGTTTGVNQREAIEELIRARNQSGSRTVIIVDAVSGQILGAEREQVPDIIFWGNQKDPAISTGCGNLLFNEKAIARAANLNHSGLDTGGKLGVLSAYGTNDKRFTEAGQTAQTPPMGLIYKQNILYGNLMNNGGEHRQKISAMQERAKEMITDTFCGHTGLRFLTHEKNLRSNTSHVLKVPERHDVARIISALKERGFSISSGYGTFKDTEVRICVYSANTLAQIESLLDEAMRIVNN